MTSQEDSSSRKRRKIDSTTEMDRFKRSQCWVLLKRLTIHPDGALFRKPFSHKVLDLETILSMLSKGSYCRTQEFAENIRATFSHAMESNPPRHELHKAARGLSRVFELNWKSLEDKWAAEKEERKKISKVPAYSEVKKTPKAKDKGCSDSKHFDNLSKTGSAEGFVKKRKHDNFRDSQCFDDATESQYREKQRSCLGLSGSKTDPTDGSVNTPSSDYLRPKIHGQAHSTHSASHVCTTVISDSKLEAKEASSNIADTKPKCSFLDTLLAAQESLFNFCRASSQKNQDEKKADSSVQKKQEEKKASSFLQMKQEEKKTSSFVQKKQEEKKAGIKAAEIKKEREASRRRLQEMERSADIEDNLQICEELDQLCGYTLKYYTLKRFGLTLKRDWDC